jgi:endoglucanase
VFLHGTNYSGPEYACSQGWGIFDGPSDDAAVAAMRSWNFNVVHVGLNESCVLGINGVPAQYAGANYMGAIKQFVDRVHAHGMYAHVSLMWAAPGTQRPSGHPPILNRDHSADALRVIANTFKDDPKTFIGLQSEPHGVGWRCWRDGGSACSVGYEALGMQAALDAVRSTGATNVVTASGINWANDLSQWLSWRPNDPLGQLAAEAHVYGGNACSSAICFNADYAPVAAQVPLVFGETGEHYEGHCGALNAPTFMAWNEANADGYESWTWNTWGNCSSLISDFGGTAYPSTYARYVRDHNRALSP